MKEFLETLKNKKVLLIDPNAAYRTNIRIILSNIGISNVKQSTSAKDSVELIEKSMIDIILCEYHLNESYSGQHFLEDLRQNQILSLKTTFFILTTEKQRNAVVSVAEFLPDAYLLKPFTADMLESRLLESLHKKHILSEIYESFDNMKYEKTIELIRKNRLNIPKKFQSEILKLEGECLLFSHQYIDAKNFYLKLKENQNIPWIYYGLSKTLVKLEEYDDAEIMLLNTIKKNPNYIHLYDFLAEVKLKQNKVDETKNLLQMANNLSDRNTNRLRKYGEILEEVQHYEEAEAIINKTADRSSLSIKKNFDDVLNLGRLSVRNKNKNNIKKTIGFITSYFKNQENNNVIKNSLESSFHFLSGDSALAHKFLERALDEYKENSTDKVNEENILLHLAECCSNLNKKDDLKEILKTIAIHKNNKHENYLQHIYNTHEIDKEEIKKDAELHIDGINEQALLLAKSGNIEEAMNLLIGAATQTPNILFLCNATKSIFTYINLNYWDEDKASLAIGFLKKALAKGRDDPMIKTTYAYAKRICEKFSVSVDSLLQKN